MIDAIVRFFCKHEYKVISPEFCMGNGKIGRLCECNGVPNKITISMRKYDRNNRNLYGNMFVVDLVEIGKHQKMIGRK